MALDAVLVGHDAIDALRPSPSISATAGVQKTAMELVATLAHHGAADLVRPMPDGAVGAEAENVLHVSGGHAVAVYADLEDGAKAVVASECRGRASPT